MQVVVPEAQIARPVQHATTVKIVLKMAAPAVYAAATTEMEYRIPMMLPAKRNRIIPGSGGHWASEAVSG